MALSNSDITMADSGIPPPSPVPTQEVVENDNVELPLAPPINFGHNLRLSRIQQVTATNISYERTEF